MTSVSPPRIVLWLSGVLLRQRDKEMLLGDVAEEYTLLASARGKRAASRWFWGQLFRSAAPLLWANIRRGMDAAAGRDRPRRVRGRDWSVTRLVGCGLTVSHRSPGVVVVSGLAHRNRPGSGAGLWKASHSRKGGRASMKYSRIAVGVLTLLLTYGLGAQSGADIDKLQGSWNIISAEFDGQSLPAGGSITIHGNRFTAASMDATYEGTFEIDATKSPRTIDMKFTAGPEAGNSNRGIYQVDQNGWRLCLATRGTERPKQFATAQGTGFALEILRRGSADTAQAAPSLANIHFEPVPELAGDWVMVSAALDGQPLDASMVALGRRFVEGSEVTVRFGPQVYAKARFTVDRSKTPMTMDYYVIQGNNSGKMQQGIYELNGETLKLCLGAPGATRPTDFSSAAGDGRTFTVWTRSQK